MSHRKILKLAVKFAQKIIITSDYNLQAEDKKIVEDFKQQFRALLNEMEGDYVSLKIKGINKNILKKFSHLYYNLLDLFKIINDQYPKESMRRLVNYVLAKDTKSFINELNYEIQGFLKEDEVDFDVGTGFSQVQINSLKKLVNLILLYHKILTQPFPTVNLHSEKLKNETTDYVPFAGPIDTTKIEKK